MESKVIIATIEQFYLNWGLFLIFLSSFIEISPLGFTIPGGLIVAIGGYFSYGNLYSFLLVLTAGFLGAWSTLILSYILGRETGDWLVGKLKQEKNAKKAKMILKKHGTVILITSMMANLIRLWVAYIAGTQRYNFSKFLLYSSIASVSWIALYASIGYLAGNGAINFESGIVKAGVIGWFLLAISGYTIMYTLRKEFKKLENNK